MIGSDTFQLVMGRGPQPGQVFELPFQMITLGRDSSNAVSISDPQVSRQHARITPQGKLLIIEDLNSTNGTTVNGVPLNMPFQLNHGDEIGLGDNVTLIFYGRFAGGADQTMPGQVVGQTVQAAPAAYQAAPVYEPDYGPPAPGGFYQQAPPAYDPAYGPPAQMGYPVAGQARDWNKIILGCIGVGIVAVFLLTLLLYLFAPYGFWKAVEDFVRGLGLDIKITQEALWLLYGI